MNEATEQDGRISRLEIFPKNGSGRPEVFFKNSVLKIYRKTNVGVSILAKLQASVPQLY